MTEAAFHAVAEPRRRAMLRLVRDQPRSVNEIAEHFDITQQAVSQHLKVLKEAGLVVDRPLGTRRIYQLDPDGLGALRAQLDRFWSQALATYKQLVEQPEEEV